MIGVCKFCGCTKRRPCFIPADYLSDPNFRVNGNVFFCAWLLEDVCTNPDCVLKAYLEVRPAAEHLMFALALLEAA